MTEKALNLFQKLVKVREAAVGFSKDAKGFGFEYVSGNQVLSKVIPVMNELNLLLVPSTKPGQHHTHEYVTSKGKDAIDFVVSGEMVYTWIDADSGETMNISWAYYGQMQDDLSKAYGSALTYSERYFLLKFLGLPTDADDPDARQDGNSKPKKPQPPSKPQPVKPPVKPPEAPPAPELTGMPPEPPVRLLEDDEIEQLLKVKSIDRQQVLDFYKIDKFNKLTKKQRLKLSDKLIAG